MNRTKLIVIFLFSLSSCKISEVAQDSLRWNYLNNVGLFNPMIMQDLIRQENIRSINLMNPPDTLLKDFLTFDKRGNLICVRTKRDSTIFYYKGNKLIAIKEPDHITPDSSAIRYKYGTPIQIDNYMNDKKHSYAKITVSDNSINILRYANLDDNEVWRQDSYIYLNYRLITEVHQEFEDNNIIKKYKYKNGTLDSDSWISDNMKITTYYDTIGRPLKRIDRNIKDFKIYWTYEYRYYQNDLFPTEIISTIQKGKSTIKYYNFEK